MPQEQTAPWTTDDRVGKRGRTETIEADDQASDIESPFEQPGNPSELGGNPGSRTNRGRAAGSSPRGVRRAKKDSSHVKPTRSTSRRKVPAILDDPPLSSALIISPAEMLSLAPSTEPLVRPGLSADEVMDQMLSELHGKGAGRDERFEALRQEQAAQEERADAAEQLATVAYVAATASQMHAAAQIQLASDYAHQARSEAQTMVAAAVTQPCPSCASWGTLAAGRLAAVEQANARVTALAANVDRISAQNTHLTTTADQLRDEIVILRGRYKNGME